MLQPKIPLSDTDATETMLEAALELARAGYAVFPLWPLRADLKCVCPKRNAKDHQHGKHPRCLHGHNDATTDEAQIERWWSEPEIGAADAWQCSPDNNIGIAVPDGLVVVDVDPRNGGWETFADVCAEHGDEWTKGLTATSGSGGVHVYLACEPGRRFPKTLDAHGGPGIDLKQYGGYVVAPPSKHKSGGAYSWDPGPGEILPAPAWLTLLSKVKTAEQCAPAPEVPDGAELDDDLRARLDEAIELIEPYYTDGFKHWIALAVGGYFRNAGLPAIAAKYVASQLPSTDPSARVNDAVWAYGPEVHRPGGAKSFRELGLDDLLQALDDLKLDPMSRMRDKQKANRENASAQPAADAAEFAGPYILQSATHSDTILLWRGADRGHQPVALGSLRLVIKDAGLQSKIPLYADVETASGKTKKIKLPAPTIVEYHGEHFDHTIYDFARRVSEYDRDRSRVIVGYPDVCIAGAFDAEVDAWLRALAGDAYPRLEAWIASCTQQNINRLAAALVLTGPADLGKSLFSCAVAGLWGAVTPPAAQLLVKQFNGELRKCAVVCDEEAQLFGSKQLSTKRFRDLTQSTERSIELKGLETFTLRGALRIIVPCNEISDLRFTDLGGPDIVKAVIDRLCVINCKSRAVECKAALARLRLPGGWVCDRDRVIAHMVWLCETVELPAERFIGAGAGAESVLAGHVSEHVDLWEKFREWLDSDATADESPAAHAPLWKALNGRLCFDPKALALALERTGSGWDQKRVLDGLAPFNVGRYKPKLGDGAQPRLWTLDPGAVAAALGLDDAEGAKLTKLLTASEPKPQARDTRNQFKPR